MISDKFLHPYHIIPAAEFVTALMEPSDKAVPHMFMEPDAVQGQPDAIQGQPDAVQGQPDAIQGQPC